MIIKCKQCGAEIKNKNAILLDKTKLQELLSGIDDNIKEAVSRIIDLSEANTITTANIIEQAIVSYTLKQNDSNSKLGSSKDTGVRYFTEVNIAEIKSDNRFSGKAICFTGFYAEDKAKIDDIIEHLQIAKKSSISSKIDYLVCGSNAGPSKIAQATSLNKEVINAENFLTELIDY